MCSELALYVLPRALDSLAMILHDRGICSGFKYGEIALFSASMSVMMYCYEVSCFRLVVGWMSRVLSARLTPDI